MDLTVSDSTFLEYTINGDSDLTLRTSKGFNVVDTAIIYSFSMTILHNITVLTSGTAYAIPDTIFWQSNDLNLFPSDYARSLATVIGVPYGASTSPSPAPAPTFSIKGPTSSATQSIQTPTSGVKPTLSKGTKVGVGVASTFGALILGAIIFYTVWLRRRKRALQYETKLPEMSGNSKGLRIFLKGEWRAEAEAESQPVEIDSRGVVIMPGPPSELEAPHWFPNHGEL